MFILWKLADSFTFSIASKLENGQWFNPSTNVLDIVEICFEESISTCSFLIFSSIAIELSTYLSYLVSYLQQKVLPEYFEGHRARDSG